MTVFRLLFAMVRFFSPQNRAVTMKLLKYSMFMIALPIIVFYLMWYFVFEANQQKYPNGLGK